MIPVRANFDIGRWFANNNPQAGWDAFHRNVRACVDLHNLCGVGSDGPVSCSEPWELLVMLQAASTTPAGAIVEVGTYWGGAAHYFNGLAQRQGRELYLYDTFEGLPCFDPSHDELPLGLLKTNEEEVRASLGPYPTIVKGWFPRVAPIPGKIAFANVDVDQYQCTKETILELRSRMIPGGVMWFDDTCTLEGARQAVRECFETWEIEETTKRWYKRF